MSLILILILFLIALMVFDFWYNRDILSPIILILSNTLILFMAPSLFKIWLGHSISYIPEDVDHIAIAQFTNMYLFLISFSFGLCMLLTQHLLKDIKVPKIVVSYKSQGHFWIHQIIAFGSFFLLMSLMPYNIWGNGAYYNMAGLGVANWAYNLLLFSPAFLFLGAKEHRKWSYLAFGCSLMLASILLDRGTQTAYMVLCAIVVLRETFQVSLKKQLLFFVIIPALVIIPKFAIVLLNNPSSFWNSFVWFITYDLGRFDYLGSAIYYKLEGLTVSNYTLFRYIPFANYLPVVKDLNDSFQALPEQLFLGSRISNLGGGMPFTAAGEVVLLLGISGALALYSLWGVIFGAIYAISKSAKNPYILGLYALFLYSAHGLAFSGMVMVVATVIFITIFCDIKIQAEGELP